jgi:hypothetical protein
MARFFQESIVESTCDTLATVFKGGSSEGSTTLYRSGTISESFNILFRKKPEGLDAALGMQSHAMKKAEGICFDHVVDNTINSKTLVITKCEDVKIKL